MQKTILFIHGAWVTPLCWSNFRSFFEAEGYRCLAPAWPYVGANPDPRLAKTTVKDLVDFYASEIRQLAEPPILIGHSFGGLIVQLLLDRGLGLAGVAIDPGPPRGVIPSPRAVLSALPVLTAFMGWNRILAMSFKGFAATFANSLPGKDMRRAYAEHIVPAPGRIYFQAALGVGVGLDFKRADRAPLLLVAGENDKTSTPDMVRAMYKRHSRSPAATDFLSFPGRSHWLIAEPGWDEVAGGISEWIAKRAPQPMGIGGVTSRSPA